MPTIHSPPLPQACIPSTAARTINHPWQGTGSPFSVIIFPLLQKTMPACMQQTTKNRKHLPASGQTSPVTSSQVLAKGSCYVHATFLSRPLPRSSHQGSSALLQSPAIHALSDWFYPFLCTDLTQCFTSPRFVVWSSAHYLYPSPPIPQLPV